MKLLTAMSKTGIVLNRMYVGDYLYYEMMEKFVHRIKEARNKK